MKVIVPVSTAVIVICHDGTSDCLKFYCTPYIVIRKIVKFYFKKRQNNMLKINYGLFEDQQTPALSW